MSNVRSESQPPHFSRRQRSNTAQSIFKNTPVVSILPSQQQLAAPPLQVGDTKVLTVWVDPGKESKDVSQNVILNQSLWPGVAEKDLIQLRALDAEKSSGFLFVVPRDEGIPKHQLQVSIPKAMADRFDLRNNCEVLLTKVDPELWSADHVELTFQDQYLGRPEMWRHDQYLVGQCLFVDQELSFLGLIAAKVQAVYVGGKKVSTAYITSRTKIVYRSLSAKVTIFIQVCKELWEFAGDGERYNEKIVHSFLPALFQKWSQSNTTHIVTIVLISRVFYDESEVEYAAGPLWKDEEGRWCKDFYKVITDLEMIYDWRPTLVALKDSFWAFQRDILLTHHHHHRASGLSPQDSPDHARLVGRLSFAHDGPILEALNLSFNPTETHYIDRSLSLTGSATIIITPGTGYFKVNKFLLRLTTTRLLDQGFAIDLVSLAKQPLHQSPVFCFKGLEPGHKPDPMNKGARALDPLWGGDDDPSEYPERERSTFWWEPFWMSVSFWDKQMDLPFRADRFVSRAKMHEIEMLGLLDHDVLSSIELPYLAPLTDPSNSNSQDCLSDKVVTKAAADKFDMNVFAPTPVPVSKPSILSRSSVGSTGTGSGSLASSSYILRNNADKRMSTSRASESTRLPPAIEESPNPTVVDLPVAEQLPFPTEPEKRLSVSSSKFLSTSPSQSSIRSVTSTTTTASTSSAQQPAEKPPKASTSKSSMRSRFSTSWLWSTFRGGPNQPQTSSASASGLTSPVAPPTPPRMQQSTPPLPAPSAVTSEKIAIPRSPGKPMTPKPMAIKNSVGRSGFGRITDDELIPTHRGSLTRHSPLKHSPMKHSPINTPPRDEPTFGKRRSATLGSGILPAFASSSPIVRTNPSKPLALVPYSLASLAKRWQHIFPTPLLKHDIKWKCMVTPACLPLTVEYFPTASELEMSYDVNSYEFVVDTPDMRSFLIKPISATGGPDTIKRAWALAVMRGMVAIRLAQGFQFVIRPPKADALDNETNALLRRSASYVAEDDMVVRPGGAAEVLKTPYDPVYLSMSNEIHRISYSGDSIQLRRLTRRMPKPKPHEYQCLIWPKLGFGYTEMKTSFCPHGLENYGWNRVDMLVAGYEKELSDQSNESLRYWRTRFVVIPTDEAPQTTTTPSGERLNEEEARLYGMDKLAEMFSRVRWISPEDRGKVNPPPVRFIPTDLGPTACVLDESVVSQLDEIHESWPMRKKTNSDREIEDMPLASIAKAMREDDGVPIKEHKWHGRKYPNSFIGTELVSWLVREFLDISNREQGVEVGTRLFKQGLFEHCRGAHTFLDGHYFYTLRGEYIIPMTPRGWFGRTSIKHVPGSRKTKKSLIMSQSMVIDIDPAKKSDQAECVILHHDLIHNPSTCFHFELQWIGTTARCIDDQLRRWGQTIERYGLKLVETYVSQISDVRDRNPFQSCYPFPLVSPPLVIEDLEQRLPEGAAASNYFESAILRKFGFVLDIEAGHWYSDQVDVVYSYRRLSFTHSQWVHRSGVCFVQILEGAAGFLFLTNRLMAPGKLGTASKMQRPSVQAERIRVELTNFCSDPQALEELYHAELSKLSQVSEEPPPLKL